MRFLRRAPLSPLRLAILSGAFHPPTTAHLALAHAAIETKEADEVLFVLPAELPHKRYEQVSLERRLEMLDLATSDEPRFSVAVSSGGLFLEIARECRSVYGGGVRLRFLCGADAAHRIVTWNYGDLPSIEEQLKEYELLVAPRQGVFDPPPELAGAIAPLVVDPQLEWISSTELRERISRGEPWEHLAPESIRERVAALYAG